MDDALKRVVVSDLRQHGFTGSLPHLRRRSGKGIEMLMVQHYSSGGSFVVEVAACPADGYTMGWGERVEPSRTRVVDMPARRRPRLGSLDFPRGDHWFTYGPRNYETDHHVVRPPSHYDALAHQVLQHVEHQAFAYWREQLDAIASGDFSMRARRRD